MYKKTMLLLCVVLMSGTALAADNCWIGGASGNLTTASNWSLGTVPGSSDQIISTIVQSDFDYVGWDAYVNWRDNSGSGIAMGILNYSARCWTDQTIETWASDGNLSIGGINFGGNTQSKMCMTTLNIRTNIACGSKNITLGSDDYTAARVNQYSGAVTCRGLRSCSKYRGVYNLYGGTLTLSNNGQLNMPRNNSGWANTANVESTLSYDEGSGVVEHYTKDGKQPKDYALSLVRIYAGTMTLENSSSSAISMPTANAPNGTIQLLSASSVLKWKGNNKTTADNLIGAGRITCASGGTVTATYDSGTNYTIIVPEPATMLMLGLGAFGLIRRRK